jgi:hypothetical protein
MKIKTQERHEDEELVSWRRKKEQEAAERRRREKEEHSVEAYESKFREIEQITGETDLDRLVDRFIQVENKNYALFNFVNELNNQVELLQDQIDQVSVCEKNAFFKGDNFSRNKLILGAHNIFSRRRIIFFSTHYFSKRTTLF